MSPPPSAAGSEPLPDDVAALKALLLGERATTTRLTGQNEHLRKTVHSDQLEFALEDIEQALAEAEGARREDRRDAASVAQTAGLVMARSCRHRRRSA